MRSKLKLLSASIAFFLLMSCKSFLGDSSLTINRDRGSPYKIRVAGFFELMDWLEGKRKTLPYTAASLRKEIYIENGNIKDAFVADSDEVFMRNLEDLKVLVSLQFPNDEADNIEKEMADFSHKLKTKLSFKFKADLVRAGFHTSWHPGKPYIFDIPKYFVTLSLLGYGVEIFSKDEIKKAINDLVELTSKNRSSNESLVKYDGNLGYYRYFDEDLERAVVSLTYLIMLDLEKFKGLVRETGHEASIFYDTNSMSSLSRVEPFDLLANMAGVFLNREDLETKKIRIVQDFVNSSLRRKFGIANETSEPFAAFKADDGIKILCEETEKGFKRSLVYDTILYRDLVNDHFTLPTSYECGGKYYNYSYQVKNAEKLKRPKPFSEVVNAADTLKVKTYVTLAKEIAPQYITAFKNLARFHGMKVVSDKTYNAREKFRSDIKEANIFVYAGHALAAYGLNIGSFTNRGILFEGVINGKKTQIELVIPNEGISLSVEKNELEDIYRERTLSNAPQDPLFVFVTSCNSESNVLMWPAIHRSAFSGQSISARRDLPYVIASNRSFATGSSYEIMSHVFYPIDVISMAASGKEIDDIYHYLNTKIYEDLLSEARTNFAGKAVINSVQFIQGLSKEVSKKIKQIRNGFSGTDEEVLEGYYYEDNERTFSPAYSYEKKYLDKSLSISGRALQIQSPEGKIMYSFDL